MANRFVLGPLPGGGSGLRVSIPGYDVLNEPYGSNKVAFDSRFTEIGTVIAQGVCGLNQVINFPFALSFIPVAMFNRVDPRFISDEQVFLSGGGHTNSLSPYIGIVTTSTFQVIGFTTPYYGYSSGGGSFAYSIFGAQT